MDLAKRTELYIREQGLLQAGDRVLLAVSGGVDSLCLAHIILSLRSSLRIEAAVAHFDHKLRPESAEEALFVADFAASHDTAFFSGSADIRALGGNIEDTARKERYAFLRSTAKKIGACAIAVAHHADDQAETVLLHLLRGSGPNGLAAMAPKNNDIIRPLLFASRSDILDYADCHGLEYCEDASNQDITYLRNRIRHQLLPQLASYNPRIREALNTTADICREENYLLDEMAEYAFAQLWLEERNALNKDGLSKLPLALRRRVVRKAWQLLTGEDLDFAHTEAVLQLGDEDCVQLPGDMKAYQRDELYFAPYMPQLPKGYDPLPVEADNCWHRLADTSWQYKAALSSNTSTGEKWNFIVDESLLPQLAFRCRQEGDRVDSSGKAGSKKIKDIFIDKHIPVYLRAQWPVLIAGEDIIWLAGLWKKEQIVVTKPVLIKLDPCVKI